MTLYLGGIRFLKNHIRFSTFSYVSLLEDFFKLSKEKKNMVLNLKKQTKKKNLKNQKKKKKTKTINLTLPHISQFQ